MRNAIILFALATFFVGCKSTMIYNYSTVQDIYGLKSGMSMQEVNNTLKVLPYEFYTNFEDGNKVLVYKYRRTYQRVILGNETRNLNNDTKRYKDDEDLFVVFDQKSGEMLYYISNTGRKSSKGVLANSNKLNLIKSAPLLFQNSTSQKSNKIALAKKVSIKDKLLGKRK